MKSWISSLVLAFLLLAPLRRAEAAPALRAQMDVAGDFQLFGNTLVHECDMAAPVIPDPVVGTIGTCTNSNNYAPDVYWRADDPTDGQATADDDLGPDDARSTAVLQLPEGAHVVYARLYWGAYSNADSPDDAVRVQRPSSGLDTLVMADDDIRVNNANTGRFWYQSTADVTALVQAQGPGAYRIAEVNSIDIVSLGDVNVTAAWYAVVLYSLDGEPSRNLALFDGLDLVDQNMNSVMTTLSGFLVPQAGYDAKLGVVAYEGEAQLNGDSLLFNGTTLSNAVNPANNFFNASRSAFGAPLSVVGDLPQLTGGPRSLSNVDFDVMDVTALVSAGATMATVEARTNQDTFLLASFITSISTLKPDFVTSSKTVTDVNGGAVRPGDTLEYRIEIKNTGSDTSVETVVTDVLPAGVSYVAGSLEVVSGANAGAKTDDAGDDQAAYVDASRTVIFNVGDGAVAANGGDLAVGESSVVRFLVTVDANASGTISNQAVINAKGMRGAPAAATPTDGNGVAAGQPPTDVVVDACETDADCSDPTPFCDITSSPRTCVTCVTSVQCTDDAAPDCNFTTHVCECTGGGSCDDDDGDGISNPGEEALGSDPKDADSDDDGVPDGSELAPNADSDGDGAINALDPDSDDDGLFDGTELGFSCEGDGIDLARKRCRPDGDKGATTTSPLDRDSDGGGASDGSEDFDLDGVVDDGETDPTAGHGDDDVDVADKDGDGLSDALEATLHSDPDDADSDDDGALDGEEANPSDDGDLDGLVDVIDVDSDDDALFDGTELGKGCDNPATNGALGCRPDNDGGATRTSPVLRDTDGGGAIDGSEDANLNGVLDANETDPTATHGSDDDSATDGDGDGLSDALETTLGTDPADGDSDDDGALDGEEANPSQDYDGDGKIDALDPDSDGDGLFDGTELGKSCARASTDSSKNQCVADADKGATRTGPLNADSDYGGVADGEEDTNQDGQVDPGERDPNDPIDDMMTPGPTCKEDSECGGTHSGVLCVGAKCVIGCRGDDGNGCPVGLECTSSNVVPGKCVEPSDAGAKDGGPREPGERDAGEDNGGHGGTGMDGNPGGSLGGGGCDCRTSGSGSSDAAFALLALLWVSGRRRRRHGPSSS